MLDLARERDRMVEVQAKGGKAVVWAHNSHIGNAAFTEMGISRGELNIGQLARVAEKRHPANVLVCLSSRPHHPRPRYRPVWRCG